MGEPAGQVEYGCCGKLAGAASDGTVVYKTVYMGARFGSIPEIQKLVESTIC
jgi:hypothetical protein